MPTTAPDATWPMSTPAVCDPRLAESAPNKAGTVPCKQDHQVGALDSGEGTFETGKRTSRPLSLVISRLLGIPTVGR